ncbi:MAG: hypothetical protein LCI00_14370 [Chloroflexi bacterium]|nr:hypothetical protein [Chloroflexota bacterium]MCC6895099.1 hypothetical protein [Anaerolineae bacterium]
MIWWRYFWWMFWRMALSGALCGAVFGTLILPLLGTVFGLIYGGMLGVIVGVISAVMEVVLIRFHFNPPVATKAFQWWSVGVVVVSTAFVSFWLLNEWFPVRVVGPIWVVLPALIATVAAGYFAWKYPVHAARLYAQKDLVEDDYPVEGQKSPIVW